MTEPEWAEYNGDWERIALATWRWASRNRPDVRDIFERREVSEMEKNGMISLENTPPEDDTKCASEDQLEEHLCKRLSECACQAKSKVVFDGEAKPGGITRSDIDEALKAFRDGGCCGN